MVLNLNRNMSDEEVAKIQSANVVEKRKEAVIVCSEKVKSVQSIEASDQKILDAQEKAKLEEENATIKRQNDLREKYLATPLTEGERVELQGLEAMCQTGQNPDKGNMFRLADLRAKAEIDVKARKKAEAAKEKAEAEAEEAKAKAEAKK